MPAAAGCSPGCAASGWKPRRFRWSRSRSRPAARCSRLPWGASRSAALKPQRPAQLARRERLAIKPPVDVELLRARERTGDHRVKARVGDELRGDLERLDVVARDRHSEALARAVRL